MFTERILIIAEVAQAHEGSLGMAHAFIEAAARAGADAIKFQTHFAAEESTPEEPWRVKFSTQDASRYDYWKRMEFTPDQWLELSNHAHQLGILFISSPFSLKAIETLTYANADAFKVASGEINNLILLDSVACTGKPILLSTGMSPYVEIDKAINILTKGLQELMIFQCTSEYPVEPKHLGLNLIRDFKERYNLPVGLSDHSGNIFSGLAAISLGADALEVHVTFSKDMFGPDVPASITFQELSTLVEGARWIREALNHPVNKDLYSSSFEEYRRIFMKSFVASKDIPAGHKFTFTDVKTKKPCIGIPASEPERLIGKNSARFIKEGSFIMQEDVQNVSEERALEN